MASDLHSASPSHTLLLQHGELKSCCFALTRIPAQFLQLPQLCQFLGRILRGGQHSRLTRLLTQPQAVLARNKTKGNLGAVELRLWVLGRWQGFQAPVCLWVTRPHGGKGDRQQREFCGWEAHTGSSLRLGEKVAVNHVSKGGCRTEPYHMLGAVPSISSFSRNPVR